MTSPTDPPRSDGAAQGTGSVDLYWIPLGSGTTVVRLTGKVVETLSAAAHRRARCDLYHSALVVESPSGRYVIE
ncbi:MAG TPA: hypothetical protein VII96_01140 [Acidimicrobiales bacterium]